MVKNRAPASIQITSEQLIRESNERQSLAPSTVIANAVNDAEEYQSSLRSRRKGFEDDIRRQREHIGTWIKYARFEEESKDLERSRSVYERALEVDFRGALLWQKYAEFEMRNEFVNRARNVWDRATLLLPRVDQLWYKYTYMEEAVGDMPKCRAVFDRWMAWCPDDNAWLSYARFESRCGTNRLATDVLDRYVSQYPSGKAFLKFARWAEHDAKDVRLSRDVYERALVELPPESVTPKVFLHFANFEERHGEHDRARIIYRHAVDLFKLGGESDKKKKKKGGEGEGGAAADADADADDKDDDKREALYSAYVSFEKKFGSKDGVENLVLTKQRAELRAKVSADPTDYDSWFEWARLEESGGGSSSPREIRDVYERAVSNVPPASDKAYWRRYIYLWINYALWEELEAGDATRASEVWKACLALIPHAKFSFSKVWVMAAKNAVRRQDLKAARSTLGRAIGVHGKETIFKEYIALELALGEVDRCRTLYGKYLEAYPHNCEAWKKYAALEKGVGETERCRALLELAIAQPALDMPEQLWKAFIDFEIEEGEGDNARRLFKRLLDKTGHVKVWISYAQFEGSEVGAGMDTCREVFQRAYDKLKEEDLKEERVLLLDAWRALEKKVGKADKIAAVDAMLPRRIKKKRMRTDPETGAELGWEEYYDYAFPDDKKAGSNLKLLEMAAKWKAQKRKAEEEASA